MSLEDLIEQRKGFTMGEPPVAPGPDEPKGVAAEGAETPKGVAQVVTPNGLGIYYQAAPKRFYNLFTEEIEPFEVPSVSTVLDVLEKGGLSWWGMKVGIAGSLVTLAPEDLRLEWPHLDGPEVDAIVKRLQAKNLDVNKVKGKAADRGTNVHTALELYADTGKLPDPQFYPESERGYVEGLVEFLLDSHLKVEHSEVMVGSTDGGGFAGRFDIVGQIDGNVAYRCFPKNPSKYEHVQCQSAMVDLKTSKGVYPSYKIQTAGYVGAYEQCGYGQIERSFVLRVTPDGKYELVESHATYEDFLAVLTVHNTVKRLK